MTDQAVSVIITLKVGQESKQIDKQIENIEWCVEVSLCMSCR